MQPALKRRASAYRLGGLHVRLRSLNRANRFAFHSARFVRIIPKMIDLNGRLFRIMGRCIMALRVPSMPLCKALSGWRWVRGACCAIARVCAGCFFLDAEVGENSALPIVELAADHGRMALGRSRFSLLTWLCDPVGALRLHIGSRSWHLLPRWRLRLSYRWLSRN